jgi:uncharacterized protein YndB with AHSA1/START domain
MTTLAGIGDDAVRKATGRSWAQWIAALDAAGAATRNHRAIVALVSGRLGLERPWWRQMVAVGYEQAKGLRAVHQRDGGFAANASRTIGAPAAAVFAAWENARRRAAWLPDPLTIRKATAPKSLRITWSDGTHVDVEFTAKGRAKTQVAVEHSKLAGAAAVAASKAHWKEALARLAARVAPASAVRDPRRR